MHKAYTIYIRMQNIQIDTIYKDLNRVRVLADSLFCVVNAIYGCVNRLQ